VTLIIYVDVCTLSLVHFAATLTVMAAALSAVSSLTSSRLLLDFILSSFGLRLSFSVLSLVVAVPFDPDSSPVPITICLSVPSVTDPILAYPSSGWAVYPFTNPILTNWFRLLRSVAGIR